MYTKESYHEYLMSLLPESDFILDVYNGTEKPCEIICNMCGTRHYFKEANKIARRARRGNKNVCKNCENNDWTKMQKIAKNKALYLLEQKKTIELVGNLKTWSSRQPALWHCKKCNHNFERTPFAMFSSGSLACPWCETHPFKYSTEMVEIKAKELWGTEYTLLNADFSKNKSGSKRVLVQHNKCGFKYNVSLYNFLHGQGCPRCRASHGERRVRQYLTSRGFVFQEQYVISTNNTYLKLDFYLEENNHKYAIEYNGIQHYQPVDFFDGEEGFRAQQERDKMKQEYCKINNIDLIIIPYNDESIINSESLAQRLHNQVV